MDETGDVGSGSQNAKMLRLEAENRRLTLDALRVPQLEDELDTAKRRHEQLLTQQHTAQRAAQDLRTRISDLESQLAATAAQATSAASAAVTAATSSQATSAAVASAVADAEARCMGRGGGHAMVSY